LLKNIKNINPKDLNERLYLSQRTFARFVKRHRTIKLLHLLRNYSALVVVLSCSILVSATNVAAGKGTTGFLFGYFDSQAQASSQNNDKINGQVNKKDDLALVPLLEASSPVDPKAKDNEDQTITIQGQGVLSAAVGATPMKDPEQDGGVKMYIVKDGDTLSSIASDNNISVNTILWGNNISNADQIKPGDTIFILPVSGIQYKVQSGDNIDSIASKFKAEKDKIIAFNNLPANGDLQVGSTLTIPDGQGQSPQPAAPTTPSTNSSGGILGLRQYANNTGGTPQISGGITGADHDDGRAGSGHGFPYGYCTWYVAQKRYVPWSGNAGAWLFNAKIDGYATGRTPRVGSIMVTTENRYYGHVAYVEKVMGSTFTVSEMNYVGFAKKDFRTLAVADPAIKGFIY
jgi:LysM repeat protein